MRLLSFFKIYTLRREMLCSMLMLLLLSFRNALWRIVQKLLLSCLFLEQHKETKDNQKINLAAAFYFVVFIAFGSQTFETIIHSVALFIVLHKCTLIQNVIRFLTKHSHISKFNANLLQNCLKIFKLKNWN